VINGTFVRLGLDLQSAILDDALLTLKREIVLPTAGTKAFLNVSIEKFGESLLGPFPSDLSAALAWDEQLSKALIDRYFFKGDSLHFT